VVNLFVLMQNGTVQDQNDIEIWSLKKLLVFNTVLLFMVSTKSGANFGHFERMVVNKIKPGVILGSKRSFFSL